MQDIKTSIQFIAFVHMILVCLFNLTSKLQKVLTLSDSSALANLIFEMFEFLLPNNNSSLKVQKHG